MESLSQPTPMILAPSPENILRVSEALKSGDVVAIPTETVYGLAGDALNPEALAKIFQAKERPTFDPLIVHVREELRVGGLQALSGAGLIDTRRLTAIAQQRAEKLIERFWPGPLTLVLPKNPRVPDLATAGLPSVAIRMPKHPVAQAILKMSGLSLAAPSANRFGKISPTQASHVVSELAGRISYVVDGGSCEIGLESTVVSIADGGTIRLLRPGKISKEEIESLLYLKVLTGLSGEAQALAQEGAPQVAPGMLESHYAPEKPLYLLSKPLHELLSLKKLQTEPAFQNSGAQSFGILLMKETSTDLSSVIGKSVETVLLSKTGDLKEIAQNLFAGLRKLDESSAQVLIVEPCLTTDGLGYAVMDRLKRASAKRS